VARIQVFAKAPTAGHVKTRLFPAIDGKAAALLHRRLVRHALETACDAAPGRVELHCSPSTDHPFFAKCAVRHDLALLRQCEGDIGVRMAYALRAAAPDNLLLLIGTDCPARTVADLLAAIEALESGCDAVLGPVEDGGYSLIGLSRFKAQLFDGIAWSTDQVLAQTLTRLRHYDFRVRMLPARWDVDRPDDLVRLQSTHPSLLDGIDRHACMPG
jgi:rSAM/selenodomain-associated transferase 1